MTIFGCIVFSVLTIAISVAGIAVMVVTLIRLNEADKALDRMLASADRMLKLTESMDKEPKRSDRILGSQKTSNDSHARAAQARAFLDAQDATAINAMTTTIINMP